MHKRIAGMVVGLITFLTLGAGAASDLPRAEFSINPGWAMPAGATSDYTNKSFSLDGNMFYRIHDIVMVGGELGYIFGAKLEGTVPGRIVGDVDGDGIADPISFNSDINTRILHVTPQIKIGPVIDVSGTKVNPYVVGGGGLYWTHFTNGTLTLTGQTSRGFSFNGRSLTADSENDVNGGWNIGGGASVSLPQNWSIGFEVRYHDIKYKEGDDTKFIIPAFRITLQFI